MNEMIPVVAFRHGELLACDLEVGFEGVATRVGDEVALCDDPDLALTGELVVAL